MDDIKTPTNLGPKAKKFYTDAVDQYDFNFAELSLLEEACRELDLIVKLEKELRSKTSLTVKGSMGQEVSHPIVSELRMHRSTFAGLLKALKLDGSDAPGQRSANARTAAKARWGS